MIVELDEKDLNAIAQRVFDCVKPLVQGINRPPETHLFDVKELAAYLGVNETWVYDQTKRNKIPYVKIGKYLRFKKSEIDKFLESMTIRPIVSRN